MIRVDRKPLTLALIVAVWFWAFVATARADWSPWGPIGKEKFDSAIGVAVHMPSAGQVNLLAVGNDRKVYGNTWLKEKGWKGWTAYGDLKLPAKTHLEILMTGHDKIELFAVGPNGKVRNTSWDKAGLWKEWSSVAEQAFDPSTRVTALALYEGRVDLLAVGKDHKVYATSREVGKDWQEWAAIGDQALAATASLTAISRSAERIDLFAIDPTGRLRTTSWKKDQGWQKWSSIGDEKFLPGSPVAAAVSAPATSRIELFALRKTNHQVLASFREDEQEWQKWSPVGKLQFSTNARLSAHSGGKSSQKAPSDLFAVGPAGAIRTNSVSPGTASREWGFVGAGTIDNPIAADSMFPVGSRITVLDRRPHGEKRIELFGIRNDGRIYASFSETKE